MNKTDGPPPHPRRATAADIPLLERLIECSARSLASRDYTPEQIDGALASAWGVDAQLIEDGTYFVFETEGQLIACGGWSFRQTLFGRSETRSPVLERRERPERLDPARDPARIRAFFVHPDWARRGLGRLLLARCEQEARQAGFRSATLVATLPGERLYLACGYQSGMPFDHPLGPGGTIRFVPMSKSLG